MKKIMASMLALLIAVSGSANAMTQKIDYKIRPDKVTVSGQADGDYAMGVLVAVVKESVDISSLYSESLQNNAAFLRVVKTNDSGEFQTDIGMNENRDSGWYNIYTRCENRAADFSVFDKFYFINKADKDELVRLFNVAGNDGEKGIEELITEYTNAAKPVLNCTADEYYTANSAEINAVFIKERTALSGFGSCDEVETAFNNSKMIVSLNGLTSADDILNFIDANKDVINFKKWDLYEKYKADTAADILSAVSGGKHFESVGEVTEQIILSILNHSSDTNEVNELISAYFETFGVTEQQYKKYDYTKLNSALLSKGFTSMDQVVAALSAKMAALDNDTSVTPSPSGGGGGGGNSGSVGTYVPPVKNVDDAMTFTDVDSNAWYYQAVKEMVKSGVISGMSPDTFSPDEPVTREQFTKMLVTALKLSSESENAEFTDVDADAWYAPYIRTAVAHKIIFGKDDGSFGVGEKLTREDMAVLLVRAASLADIPLRNEFSADFDDYDSVSGYAYEAVGAAAADGILSGMGNGMFMPREICTRAQAAQGIYNLMNR